MNNYNELKNEMATLKLRVKKQETELLVIFLLGIILTLGTVHVTFQRGLDGLLVHYAELLKYPPVKSIKPPIREA